MFNGLDRMKSIHVYIEIEHDRRLEQQARARGQTKSALIREAIEDFLGRAPEPSTFSRALQETAGALPELRVSKRDDWGGSAG